MIKYFIEHKETHLWWYCEKDYDSPHYISTFRGDRFQHGFNYKSAWTNDPNHPDICYDTFEKAEHAMNFRSTMDTPDSDLFITEHLFL